MCLTCHWLKLGVSTVCHRLNSCFYLTSEWLIVLIMLSIPDIMKLMCWQKTALFFRGLQPVPNEEVFKIYEGTHLAITKINPSNFLNVGISSVCPVFYSVVSCLYNKSFYSHIFLIVSHTYYDQLADRHKKLMLS